MHTPYEPHPIDGLLDTDDVLRLTKISRSTLWRFRREGSFPEPQRIGMRKLMWRRSAVEAWIAAQPLASEKRAA